MLLNRIAAARKILRKYRCSHLFVSDPATVFYLCGFHSSNAYVLLSGADAVLFSDFRYQEAAERFCRIRKFLAFRLFKQGEFSILAEYARPGAKIGFQSDAVTVALFDKLKKAVPRARFVPIAGELSDIGIVKTGQEIAVMRRAASIGDRAFARFCGKLQPGITEQRAAALLDRLCSELGSEKPAFDTIVLFGPRSALPHGQPGGRRLKSGDFVLVDFGCTVKGYCSDMTRTMVAGKPSARQREIYDIVKMAQAEARRAARAGLRAGALDNVARKIIENAGFGPSFGHGLGHGLGRRVHEQPRLASTQQEPLHAGSVVTIEPGIYLPGFGGVRIEDMVVLTRKGSQILTQSPRNLIEL